METTDDETGLILDAEGEHQLDATMTAEHFIQVMTARRFPRVVSKAVEEARKLVTYDEDTARACIYSLPARDKETNKPITGPSIRFAEILQSCWGNIRSGSAILREEDRFIVARGTCIDLQTNAGTQKEVRRRITKKNGDRFGDDMIGVTGGAAQSIALRNAILTVIPKAIWKRLEDAARITMLGKGKTWEQKVSNAFQIYKERFAATVDDVLHVCRKRKPEDLDIEDLEMLHGLITSIHEGSTTWAEVLEKANAIEADVVRPSSAAFTEAAVTTRETHKSEPRPSAPAPATQQPATAPPAVQNTAPVAPQAPAAQAPAPEPSHVVPPVAAISDDDITNLFRQD